MQVGTDLDLIDASRRGDTAAFAQIIERYHRAVYAVAFSCLRDRSLADDITQDTFVAAWRRMAELRDVRKLPAWLCGIARNRSRDTLKRVRRETLGEPDEAIDTTTPYDALTEAESERLVATALGQVPDVYREPLVLYYYEDRSIEDVARSLGISAATTNKRLSRGRQYLAERVATIVERGLTRRAPSRHLAASVLAIIGITLPASHVDASPAVSKGTSTMHKLAIAATVLATATAGGIAIVSTTRSSSASSSPSGSESRTANGKQSQVADPWDTTANHGAAGGDDCLLTGNIPSLPKVLANVNAAANDCAAVGRHLSELEADATHGPEDRPDDETCAKCAAHYTAICDKEAWSLQRRICSLAAPDLINAHLCAGQPGNAPVAQIPDSLTCDKIAAHITPITQGAGLYADVADFGTQIETACEVGAWSIELRQCFIAGQNIDALKACLTPPE